MSDKTTRLIEQLRPFLRDEDAYGRFRADIHDLKEICTWFLEKMNPDSEKSMSVNELEDFLIELDVNFIDHGIFHLRSLKAEIESALKQFPDDSEGRKDLRAVL
jgi:hypothetical protein